MLAPIPSGAGRHLPGLNYQEHAEESSRFKSEAFEKSKAAVYFSKRVNRAVAPGEAIQGHLDLDEQLDYEAELAGSSAGTPGTCAGSWRLTTSSATPSLNDVSARSLQGRHKQWYFAKSLDGLHADGPLHRDGGEFNRPPELLIRPPSTGEPRQYSNTGRMLFDIPHIIAELSGGMTLKAGTIISTGTPAGVGMGMQPPRFLKKGDVVCCEIEGIGALENTVG